MRYIGEHPCGNKIIIYYNKKYEWDYICPVCKYPIDKRQMKEDENGGEYK